MKNTDLVFVDIETTGLSAREHEIIEIAVIRVTQKWHDGEDPKFSPVFEWSVKVQPENIASADPVSLKINGYNSSDWENAIPIKEALTLFSEKTEGAIMVSHNVAFDAGFLDHALATHGIENKMHYHRLDTISIAYAKLHSSPDAGRYSLRELSKQLGIEQDRAHSALPDTQVCFELFKKLMSM